MADVLIVKWPYVDRHIWGKCPLMMKAESAVMNLQTKKSLTLPEKPTKTRGNKKGYSYTFQKDYDSADNLISDFFVHRTSIPLQKLTINGGIRWWIFSSGTLISVYPYISTIVLTVVAL